MASTSSIQEEVSIPQSKYQVFLSFRGEDTRNNFTDRLFRALIHAGIHTFRDDDELRRGENIASELLTAIEQSKVSVIVFSRNYADSRWCLDELVKIMECRRNFRQTVLPVFYDVNPSDVRKQSGSFAEAFSKHEFKKLGDGSRLEMWREALTEAANLSGWDLHDVAKGHESKFIQKVVEEITFKLNHKYFSIAVYPVGIDSRVEDVISLLQIDSDNVRMVGIYGMGGIGKTTIAKAVYNLIFQKFEGSCFLEDVGDVAKRPNGLVKLQKQLLSETLLRKKFDVKTAGRGINVIKDRLFHKKVILVLDNVDHLDQLIALAGGRNWFGIGSRIIMTTRDEHLLKVLEVDGIYNVPNLRHGESLQLFSLHAFQSKHPTEDYKKLSKDIVGYAGGLPLALEVLGCFLYNETCIDVWKNTLEKLKMIPNKDILNKLRISFDGLNDDEEKNVFLDIACFFIGMDKEYVIKILKGCGFFSEVDIRVLTQRCLLVIDEDNNLKMHDLIRDMGREIVRQESLKEPGKRSRLWFHETTICYVFLKEPGKRSRLWFHEDVHGVLEKQSGTSAVEGLILNFPRSDNVHMSAEAFAKMHKLRLLNLNFVHVSGGYGHLSKELRWLCWHGFLMKYIPTSFHLDKLVALDMRYSGLTQIWKENKVLNNLKVLNLSHSHCLTKTPNFCGLPALEKLLLKDCASLVEVHPSIGNLDKLVVLNLKDCPNLKNLPGSVCMLKSLEYLVLSGCSKLDELPEDLGKMESLKALLADETAIKQVPFSINFLKNLRRLSLCGCKGTPPKTSLHSLIWSWVSSRSRPDPISLLPTSLSGLTSLRRLSLPGCNLTDDGIPADIGSLSSLIELDLRFNNFSRLPDSISHLPILQSLKLNDCRRLQSLPELPRRLEFLVATNCSSLERISNASNLQKKLSLMLEGCQRLVEIQGIDKLQSIDSVHMEGCNNLTDTFKNTILQELPERCITGLYLPGSEVPDWCSHRSMGSTVSFEVPQTSDHMIKGLTLCVIYSSNEDLGNTVSFVEVEVRNKTKGLEWTPPAPSFIPITSHDHLWVTHISHATLDNKLEGGDQVEVSVTFTDDITEVKKCGIRVVFKLPGNGTNSSNQALIQYASSSCENADVSFDNDGNEGECVSTNTGRKRGVDDSEAEPSSGLSTEDDPSPKRLRTEGDP